MILFVISWQVQILHYCTYFIRYLYLSVYIFLLSLPTSEHEYLNFLLLTCSKQAFACSLDALEGKYLFVVVLHHWTQE